MAWQQNFVQASAGALNNVQNAVQLHHANDPAPTCWNGISVAKMSLLFAAASPGLGLLLYRIIKPFTGDKITVVSHLSATQALFVAIFLLFLVLLLLVGGWLLAVANAYSISAMVAQRYNKVSYLAGLLTAGVSFFTSCFAITGAISRELVLENGKPKTNNFAAVFFATLSPLITCVMLAFPVVVHKNAYQLDMVPNTATVRNPAVLRLSVASRALQMNAANGEYEVKFYKDQSEGFHTGTHLTPVLLGIFSGWGPVLWHAIAVATNPSQGVEIGLVAASAVFLILFAVFAYTKWNDNHKRDAIAFTFEFLGVFYYLTALIYTSFVAGDLFD